MMTRSTALLVVLVGLCALTVLPIQRLALAEEGELEYQGRDAQAWQERLVAGDPREQRVAMLALHRMCPLDPAVESWLAHVVAKETDVQLRRRAAWALVPLRAVGQRAARKALADPDAEVQQNMLRSLGWTGRLARHALPDIVAVARDEDQPDAVRGEALATLANLGDLPREVLDLIVHIAVRDEGYLAVRARALMPRIGVSMAPALLEARQAETRATRRTELLEALGTSIAGASADRRDAIVVKLPTEDRAQVRQVIARVSPDLDPESHVRALLQLPSLPRVRPALEAQIALPVFRKLLLTEIGARQRASLVRWVGMLGEQARTERALLRKHLRDPDPEVRRQAAWAMSKVGGLDAADEVALREVLENRADDVRLARPVHWALAIRARELQSATLENLRSLAQHPELAQAARYVLALNSPEVDETEMARITVGPDRWARHLASAWLKENGRLSADVAAWFREQLAASDPAHRLQAIVALGAYGVRGAALAASVAAALPGLEAQHFDRALYVLAGMGRSGQAAIPTVQQRIASDRNTEALLRCLGALGDTSDATLTWMRRQLFGRYQNHQRAAARALATVGPEGWPLLIEVLGQGRIGEETTDAAWAAYEGFRFAPIEAATVLAAAREAAPPLRRGNLVRALGAMAARGADLVEHVRHDADHAHWFVRACAAEALASAAAKHETALAPLGKLLRDVDVFVRTRACHELSTAGASDARTRLLLDALNDGDARVQALGARAVNGAVAGEEVLVPRLREIRAAGRSPDARREADRALHRFAR